LIGAAAAVCALAIGVPIASAGWEGQIDFATLEQGGSQIDYPPAGPSAGDLQFIKQTVQVIGLTRSAGPLRIGAVGTLNGTLVFLNPVWMQANLTVTVGAGLIRVTGLMVATNGPPTIYSLFARGFGGMLTGSRGPVVIYGDEQSVKAATQSGFQPPPKGASFSMLLR